MESHFDDAAAIARVLAAIDRPKLQGEKLADLTRSLVLLRESGLPALREDNAPGGPQTLVKELDRLKTNLGRVRFLLMTEEMREAIHAAANDKEIKSDESKDIRPTALPDLLQFAQGASAIEQTITHFLQQKSDYDASNMKEAVGHWSFRSLGDQVTDEQYLRRRRLEPFFSPSREIGTLRHAIMNLIVDLYEQAFEEEFSAYRDRSGGGPKGAGLDFACTVIDSFELHRFFDYKPDETRSKVCHLWENISKERLRRAEREASLSQEERDALGQITIRE
jgi:hypothetical protein